HVASERDRPRIIAHRAGASAGRPARTPNRSLASRQKPRRRLGAGATLWAIRRMGDVPCLARFSRAAGSGTCIRLANAPGESGVTACLPHRPSRPDGSRELGPGGRVHLEEVVMEAHRLAACLAAASVGIGAACAQDYPTRPVRIVTATPGGGNDFLARIIAPPLSDALGQNVVVDNRASRLVAPVTKRSTPDGYTLAVG